MTHGVFGLGEQKLLPSRFWASNETRWRHTPTVLYTGIYYTERNGFVYVLCTANTAHIIFRSVSTLLQHGIGIGEVKNILPNRIANKTKF